METARAQLLEQYLPLARRLAAVLYARRAVDHVEFGDYLQLAHVGLLEAMARYRPESEAQFATFATYRIRGSILNGVPKMTEVGDHISYLRRVQRERTRSLLDEGAAPSEFDALLDLVAVIALTHQLDELAAELEMEAPGEHEPYASRLYDDVQGQLREVLAELPNRERQIIGYHYFHQMRFDEIAEVLDISRGRVSQLHKQALAAVRQALRQRRLSELY